MANSGSEEVPEWRRIEEEIHKKELARYEIAMDQQMKECWGMRLVRNFKTRGWIISKYVECTVPRPKGCWNCRSPKHGYQWCPNEPTVFCYRCGHQAIWKKECWNCSGALARHNSGSWRIPEGGGPRDAWFRVKLPDYSKIYERLALRPSGFTVSGRVSEAAKVSDEKQ